VKKRDLVDVEIVSTERKASVMGGNVALDRLDIQRCCWDRRPLHSLALQHSWVGAIDESSPLVVVNGDGAVVDETIG
jgi:hypothetical protein